MMKNYDMKSYQKKLKREMDEGRYQHTLGVMYTSAALAMRYEYDIQKAQMAGLLHDCAKCIPNGKKLKLCEKHNIQITEVERRNPFLLHAKLGAFLAMHEYGIDDKEIVSAILNHTTGKPMCAGRLGISHPEDSSLILLINENYNLISITLSLWASARGNFYFFNPYKINLAPD